MRQLYKKCTALWGHCVHLVHVIINIMTALDFYETDLLFLAHCRLDRVSKKTFAYWDDDDDDSMHCSIIAWFA